VSTSDGLWVGFIGLDGKGSVGRGIACGGGGLLSQPGVNGVLKSAVGSVIQNWLAIREIDVLIDNFDAARVKVFFGNGALMYTVSRVQAKHTSFNSITTEKGSFGARV
jgi:hypothetical protein